MFIAVVVIHERQRQMDRRQMDRRTDEYYMTAKTTLQSTEERAQAICLHQAMASLP